MAVGIALLEVFAVILSQHFGGEGADSQRAGQSAVTVDQQVGGTPAAINENLNQLDNIRSRAKALLQLFGINVV